MKVFFMKCVESGVTFLVPAANQDVADRTAREFCPGTYACSGESSYFSETCQQPIGTVHVCDRRALGLPTDLDFRLSTLETG